MNNMDLCQKLREIAEAMSVAPAERQASASIGTYASHMPARAAQSPDQLLDYLRLRVKYLTFDLEATRRENGYLRRMLERRSNPEQPPDNS